MPSLSESGVVERRVDDSFTFNITNADDTYFHVEGVGYGEDAYARAAGMIILGLMPSEGLEEAIDTLKDIHEFYAYPPVKSLPSPNTLEIYGLVASIG